MLKGGRVVDPASGRDGDVRRPDRGRPDRAGRQATCRSTAPRCSRCSAAGSSRRASSTSTCTCASRARSTRRRSRPARRRRSPAASPRSRACRTPIRSTITPASRSSSSRRRPRRRLARVYPIGAVSLGSSGEQLAELGEQKAAGCVAFTDDGRPVATALLMRRALEYAGMLGVPVIDHCEDPSLKGDGVAHEGFFASRARAARDSRARPSR